MVCKNDFGTMAHTPGIGNFRAKTKMSPANRLLLKYMKQTIIMSRMGLGEKLHISYLNRVTLL